MTEPAEDRPTFMPIAIAAAIVVVVLGAMWVLRFFRSDEVPDDGLVGRAVVGQNDALQRENYPDFQTYTCVAQQGSETQVLTDQRQSKSAKGNRFVDDVKDFNANGDRATATVVYHFEKTPDDKVTAPMTFVRENGAWKVCSPGPR
ncbi:MAG: lumazine-binding protein [Mycobacterium sp.]